MSKLKDNLEAVRKAAERANAAADPVVDNWLRQAANSPYTVLIVLAVLVLGVALGKFVL